MEVRDTSEKLKKVDEMTREEALAIATKNASESTSVFGQFSKHIVILAEAKKLCGLTKENYEEGTFESHYDGGTYSVNDACPVIWCGTLSLFTNQQAIELEIAGECECIVK